ncbi:Reverse transcriptase Ty1/copia-type domain-containing protein [Mycena venus]|uniref:Reverse transcriptase Ty1/copia-type domain-containing protein n=1 Tax=Mycena venus TaxID=2733690 RepID=A0A8H7DH09_9AGAR|nr:Reverse transcriptase Ty1/copia-type domain-containing protein [Mycena venus]
MPPREARTPRTATLGTKTYIDSAYWRDVRNNPKPNDMANVAIDVEPTTYRQAVTHPCADDWLQAMKEELTQLEELGTFSLTSLPDGRKALGNKWVYRNKLDEMGNIARRKARLVVLGNSEIPGTDYNPDQISSPVVRAETNRLLLALAARYNLEMHTVDVKGAYLNGELKEEIYMKQPEGFSDGTSRVWHLHKTIYGLKQSGRVWNETLDAHFKKHGYQRLLTDRCVYMRRKDEEMTIVAVHVDDMSIYASNCELIIRTEDELESSFQITRLGDAKQLLGMEIHRDRTRGTITITQSTYINKILAFHGMDSSNIIATPMDPNVKLAKLPDGESHPDIKNVYQSMVGALMYAAITTRPDIAYAVQTLSQFSSNPGPVHLTAVKRVYRYLRGTTNLGITYSASPDSNIVMHADFSEPRLYSDADWGNAVDDRKSISGFVTTVAGGAVTWSSKKQPTVALSTMEAEYIALSHAVRENLWLRQLFSELDCSETSPTPVFVDNRGTIDFTFNAGFHARSKHIDIRHHFIRDAVASNEVSLHHCASEENVADIFTKPLARPQHEDQVRKLGLTRV